MATIMMALSSALLMLWTKFTLLSLQMRSSVGPLMESSYRLFLMIALVTVLMVLSAMVTSTIVKLILATLPPSATAKEENLAFNP
jgi:uncharacterized membrane protein YqjE